MEKAKLKNYKLKDVWIHDTLWDKYINLVEEVILPFQWELINDRVDGAEKSYCIQNFKIACGEMEGTYQGMVFQDTDVAKWLEAVAYSLAKKENSTLEKTADEAIDLIARVQCEDGYLNTYYTITGKKRWSDLFEGHELYTAGHMIEAAVAYYEATGKEKFLKVVCRLADCIDRAFGTEEGKIHGYPGHPEIELALVKLYRVTGEQRYRNLAYYFVKERGKAPCYFLSEDCAKTGNYIFPEFADFGMDYVQAHLPVLQQMTAEGHAVRAVYLYSAMADLAYEYQDEELFSQCEILWENIVKCRMYITGSIGSASYGERFTSDYDLPNNTNYSETCATIGLAMFSNRMFQITKDAKYMEVVEKALYNTLLSGIALDGKHFFYVNPLEVIPEIAEHNPTMRHVKTIRQQWFGVACCPPNIARTLASLANYIYAYERDCVYVNLYLNSELQAESSDGFMHITVEANYPGDGRVVVWTEPGMDGTDYTLALRIPQYVKQYSVCVNGKAVQPEVKKGYLYISRKWEKGDCVELCLEVTYKFVRCNPKVRDNIGKTALMKGPVVYCLEEADNGKYLGAIRVDTDTKITEVYDKTLLGGTSCAVFEAERIRQEDFSDRYLYSCEEKPVYETVKVKAIPYCCWNNRGKGEMLVWMKEK